MDADLTELIFDGNSLTRGYPVTEPNSYPSQVLGLLGGGYTKQAFGVDGQTTTDMAADAGAQIDPLYDPPDTTILIAWELSNEIFGGVSAATALANWQSYCAARKAAGWTVLSLTCLPRPGGAEAARQTVNAALRAAFPIATAYPRVFSRSGATTWGDLLVDVAANPLIGDVGDNLDPTYYFGDNVHMIAAGYGQVAIDVTNAILYFETAPPPPTPTLTTTPDDPSPAGGDVAFEFVSAGATSFECSIDAAAFGACSSPQEYSGLAAGPHTFAVRAINPFGVSAPAEFEWSVSVTPLPTSSGSALGAGIATRRGARP